MWLFKEKGAEQVNNKKSYTYLPHSVCSLPIIVLPRSTNDGLVVQWWRKFFCLDLDTAGNR